MSVCLYPSHLISVPTPCFEFVHASVHVFMSTQLAMLTQSSMDSYMETWVPLCGSVCVCVPVTLLLINTFNRMCTYISTWIYVRMTVHVCSTPMHSLMKTWVPLYVSVFVSQSPHFCSNTLFWICTCISSCIYVHMTLHVSSTPYGQLHGNVGALCSSVCVSQSSCFWSHTLVRMCTCISTWIYVHLTVLVCSTPYAMFDWYWMTLCCSLFESQSPYFCSNTLFRMCTYISTCIYVHLTPHVSSTPYG